MILQEFLSNSENTESDVPSFCSLKSQKYENLSLNVESETIEEALSMNDVEDGISEMNEIIETSTETMDKLFFIQFLYIKNFFFFCSFCNFLLFLFFRWLLDEIQRNQETSSSTSTEKDRQAIFT